MNRYVFITLEQWFSTFFSTGPHYGPSASLTDRTHVIYITSSIQTNQIYNIIYSLNIMISKRLHLLK